MGQMKKHRGWSVGLEQVEEEPLQRSSREVHRSGKTTKGEKWPDQNLFARDDSDESRPHYHLSGALRRIASNMPGYTGKHWALLALASGLDAIETHVVRGVRNRPLQLAALGLGIVLVARSLRRYL